MTLARELESHGRYECLDHDRDYSNVEKNVELLIEQVFGYTQPQCTTTCSASAALNVHKILGSLLLRR